MFKIKHSFYKIAIKPIFEKLKNIFTNLKNSFFKNSMFMQVFRLEDYDKTFVL